jgi:hypothetical protein
MSTTRNTKAVITETTILADVEMILIIMNAVVSDRDFINFILDDFDFASVFSSREDYFSFLVA